MNIITQVLHKVARRIRLLRGWRGFGFGLFVGSLLALAWVVLDIAGLWLTEWAWMGSVVVVCALVGLVVGWAMPLHEKQVARSLDERAKLKDRTTAALESSGDNSEVSAAIQSDAAGHLETVDVRRAYPFRFGTMPGIGVGCLAMAALGFWLVNSGVMLDAKSKAEKEKLEKVASQIERIAKPLTEKTADVDPGQEEKDLAKRMVDMAKKLERGRMDEEEAMLQAEKLVKDAQKLAENRFDQVQNQMSSWQEQMARQEFAKVGLDDVKLKQLDMTPEQLAMMQEMQQKAGVDPGQDLQNSQRLDPEMMNNMNLSDSAKEMLNMTNEERKAMENQLSKEMEQLAQDMKNPNLTEEQMEAMQERMKQLSELMKDLKLSQDVYDAMRELMENETYKELQKLMSEMMDMQEQVASGEKLTEEQLAEMKEKLKEMMEAMEEWAEKMKDPEFKKQVEEQLKEMLEALKRGELTFGQCQACMGMLPGMGMGALGMNGMQMPGGPGNGGMYLGEGENQKRDNNDPLKGSTNPFAIKGARQDTGEESFVEIKAPTTLGSRTSVPYKKVLPEYKKSAESAMDNKKIPKKHEKRVKEYFESLGGGK